MPDKRNKPWQTVAVLTTHHQNGVQLMAVARFGAQRHPWPAFKTPNDAIITFIIPSGGRMSLTNTLRSLRDQTSPHWKAIVVFDGLEPEHADKFALPRNFLLPEACLNDPRIAFHNLPSSVGTRNCAAQVRNAGVALATTPWVGFVDDDDTLSPLYVELVEKEQREHEGSDVLIFRMYNALLSPPVLPPPDASDIKLNSVGISFAMRSNHADMDRRFSASTAEDFDLLHRMCHVNGARCTLLPYLVYFVKGKGGDLPLVQGERHVVPRNGVLPIADIAEMRHATSFCGTKSNGQDISDSHAPFVFTEGDDTFFGANVRALQKSLRVAIGSGCLQTSKYNASSEPIHVIFRPDTRPTTENYIQVQLEQHRSAFFSPDYIDKLAGAAQVWDMSTRAARLTLEKVPAATGRTFSVPTTVYHDSKAPSFRCGGWQERPSGSVHVYRGGCYYQWMVTPARKKLVAVHAGSCGQSSCRGDANEHSLPAAADVLMYGALNCSHANQRENLCDQLHAHGVNAACLHSVFGLLLSYYVCHARVVVMERFYEAASLETHRLDALLLAGKVIISPPSGDPDLDRAYRDYVIFVEREEIPAKVKEVLSNWHAFAMHARRHRAMFGRWVDNRDPLCYALRSLAVE